MGAVCLTLQGQAVPGRDAATEVKGLPPRLAPADYQSHAQAGTVAIAAEFKGHSIADLQGTLTTEEYCVVEIGLFGPKDARVRLSVGDFSLRINGKKEALQSLPYGMVIASVKDPEWEPPEPPKSKSKVSGGGGGQGEGNEPAAPVKIPIEVQRAMAQRVQKSALPEGDRAVPVAGLLFFRYRGKTEGIRSLELIYDGPAGKVSLPLEP